MPPREFLTVATLLTLTESLIKTPYTAAPTCSFTVAETMSGPVAGVAGEGTWVVKVKRGKQKIKLTSPANGAPTAVSFPFQAGDKVTAIAVSPGAALIVGGD